MEPELYRCPVLEQMGAYDEEYPEGRYDPRHYETLPNMVQHLKEQHRFSWTDKQIADWQETAKPIN